MRIKRCFTILFTLILIVSVSGMVVRAAEYRSPDDPEVSEIMARAELAMGVQLALHEYRTELEAMSNNEIATVGGYVDDDQMLVIQVSDLASRDYFQHRLQEDGHTAFRFEFVDYLFTKEYLEEALLELMDTDPSIRGGSANVREQRLEIEVRRSSSGELPTDFMLDEGIAVSVSEYFEPQYDHEGPGIHEYLSLERLKLLRRKSDTLGCSIRDSQNVLD